MPVQNVQENPGGGNTESPPAKSINTRYYRWSGTLGFDLCDNENFWKQLLANTKDIVCNEEISETGYHHWQFDVSFKEKYSLRDLKNILPAEIHWGMTKSVDGAFKYCSKSSTAIAHWTTANPWKKRKIIDKLRPWQKLAQSILLDKNYEDRKIYWLWSKKGNNGKTVFCKYMNAMFNAYVTGMGKTADIAYMLPDNPKIVLFNVPRESQNINYNALEAIKDGFLTSGKYEGCIKNFDSPKLMIFANQYPDTSKLSPDRWVIIDLDKKYEYDIMEKLLQMEI